MISPADLEDRLRRTFQAVADQPARATRVDAVNIGPWRRGRSRVLASGLVATGLAVVAATGVATTSGRSHPTTSVRAGSTPVVAGASASSTTVAGASPIPTVPGDPGSNVPKSQVPANINPEKTPILSPPSTASEPTTTEPPNERLARARAWQAQDPNSRVICLRADGTVSNMVELDRVDPSVPLTKEAVAALCARPIPGAK